MSTNDTNGTEDALNQLNYQQFVTLIPAVALFSLYMLMGLVGNSLVCYIIGFKFQSSNQNFLIVWLACFDLLSCLLAIPHDIVDLRYTLNYPSVIPCKILRFIMAFTCIGSAFVLTVIAIDRHRKICKPVAPQMTRTQIKIALTIALGIAFFLSWPAPIIFGLRYFDKNNIRAHDCSTSHKLKHTLFPSIYTGVLFLFFIILCVILITLYCKILIAIKRHSREMKIKLNVGPVRPIDPSESELTNLSAETTVHGIPEKKFNVGKENEPNDVKQQPEISIASSAQQSSDGKSLTGIVTTKESDRDKNRRSLKKATKSKTKTPEADRLEGKTTKIAFLITLVFILSFLPYLILQIAKLVDKEFDSSLKGTSLLMQNIFLRSYYINSISNPIIYGVLNRRFRVEALRLFRRFFCCK